MDFNSPLYLYLRFFHSCLLVDLRNLKAPQSAEYMRRDFSPLYPKPNLIFVDLQMLCKLLNARLFFVLY